MTAYFIAQIQWNSPADREAYVHSLGGVIEKHGGRYLITSSESRVAEGQWLPGRLVVIEFPSMADLKAWYESEEYRPALELRLKGSRSNAIMVEGNPAPPSR